MPILASSGLRPAPSIDLRWASREAGTEVSTIFPFLIRHADGRYLSLAANQDVYRGLMSKRVRLGQPVLCGERDGRPISALRLCNSARLLAEAADPQPVIERALAALDSVVEAADEIARMGRS